MNLAAKAFLFNKNAEYFNIKIIVNRTLKRKQLKLQIWQRYGLIKKLHNVVIFIRQSPQRQKIFKNLTKIGEIFAELVLI
jgi:hypothetical protein